mgnify:CR=1 FL=1
MLDNGRLEYCFFGFSTSGFEGVGSVLFASFNLEDTVENTLAEGANRGLTLPRALRFLMEIIMDRESLRKMNRGHKLYLVISYSCQKRKSSLNHKISLQSLINFTYVSKLMN